MQIKDLKNGTKIKKIEVEVVQAYDIKFFTKFGVEHKVRHCKVKDDSGECFLSLWESQVDLPKEGRKLILEDTYAKEYNDQIEITTGKFGKVKVKEMRQVEFKSIPENFKKEKLGAKANTIRQIEETDPRALELECMIEEEAYGLITITNTENKESFTRRITDISKWEGWYILSWNSEER